MLRTCKEFTSDESGAVTVDWVVLTAAVLGVLFGALTTFNQGVSAHADLTSETMEEIGIRQY
ncbi:MAG: hypothetical protein AAGP08_01420 [Pseudomonadota bacterium]